MYDAGTAALRVPQLPLHVRPSTIHCIVAMNLCENNDDTCTFLRKKQSSPR